MWQLQPLPPSLPALLSAFWGSEAPEGMAGRRKAGMNPPEVRHICSLAVTKAISQPHPRAAAPPGSISHIPPALWQYWSVPKCFSRAAWLFWQKANRKDVCWVGRDKHSYTKPAAGHRESMQSSRDSPGLGVHPAQPSCFPVCSGTGTQLHGILQTWEAPPGGDLGTSLPTQMPEFPRAGHSWAVSVALYKAGGCACLHSER